jgi:ABC-type antimicrobial peptide transport system permease subunit
MFSGTAMNLTGPLPFYPTDIATAASHLSMRSCMISSKRATIMGWQVNETIAMQLQPNALSQNYTIATILSFANMGPYKDFDMLLDLQSLWNQVNTTMPSGYVNRIDVELIRPNYLYHMSDLAETSAYLTAAGDRLALALHNEDYRLLYPLYTKVQDENDIFFISQILILFMGLISAMLCGLFIYNSVSSDVTSELREIGIQQAIGVKQRSIGIQFLYRGSD